MQPSFSEHRSVHFRVLSDDQVWEIRRAAFDVMAKTGFQVLHEGARKMLAAAGAVVDGDRVKVPEHVVTACLASTPKGFAVFDRDGNRALEVEGTKSYYGSSTASPNFMDARTGEIRPTTVADIGIGARVADALPNLDWVMPMGSSQDVAPAAADVFEFEAVVTNTSKPMVYIGYTPGGVETVCEMAAVVAGGLDRLQERPFLILYPEPISPLVFPADVIDRMFVAADLMVPQIQGPAVQPGATAPVTLAGAIVQATAESLMCLTLIQLRKPGAPCGLSANVPVFDMSFANLSTAAPEMSLALSAQAEVARSFGLPTWGLAGATDSKELDAQAGAESAFSILAQGLGGLNLIHDVGYMDLAMVCSPAQLVLGNEIIGMTRRFIEGIRVDADTLAREVIESVGPGGHFLMEDHTNRHFKSELWFPQLFDRKQRVQWEAEGGKNVHRRIQDTLDEILDTHEPAPLDDAKAAAIAEIKNRRTAELE
jgi:trimethylamine--corrinoid protein Co-methyltransferase